jgi:16S rRNA pseudouridine516 synthase
MLAMCQKNMRLDKFICHSTALSRQYAQRAIRNGLVSVNQAILKKPDQHIAVTDCIQLNGKIVCLPQPCYLMLNKPTNYVCANSDSEHPVVLDLLQDIAMDKLQIAGRLDIDTTGLVLITDDGDWNHRVTSPSRQCCKTYCVTLNDALKDTDAEQLRAGVLLAGERKMTAPAELSFINNQANQVRLSIHEGKYHQVKRMFAAVGHHVIALHRESIGSIVLDPSLAPGEYRNLTTDEIASIG